MIDKDYSFIRLRNNFDDAKNLGRSPKVKIAYNDQVRLKTDETYLQRTNVSGDGISFQANYVVNVVNCANEVLQDITTKVFIYEFSDHSGRQQIDFELRNISYDFGYDDVYLRFESATNSQYVFWSNAIKITDYNSEETTYIYYKHKSIWNGIDYTTRPYYQGIRVGCYYNDDVDGNEIDQYYQMTTGITVGTRVLFKRYEQYMSDCFNKWMQRRLEVALTCSEVYIDCVRSYYSQAMEYGERVESSDLVPLSFIVSKDLNDTKEVEDQIFATTPISITALSPIAISYPLGGLPTTAQITFNQDVTLLTGSIRLYSSSDALMRTFTESELTVTNNILQTTGDLNDTLLSADTFYFLMDAELIEGFSGITSTTEWRFSVYV